MTGERFERCLRMLVSVDFLQFNAIHKTNMTFWGRFPRMSCLFYQCGKQLDLIPTPVCECEKLHGGEKKEKRRKQQPTIRI